MRVRLAFIIFILLSASICLLQEDLGKKYYESAISYLNNGNYKQAIEDFESIIKSLPDSSYADDALLELGRYYLEIENNKVQAERYFSLLKEKYVKTENGPAGYYYLGRTNLLLGATVEDLNNAYANFERIPVLFAKSKWVQQAFHDAGVAQRYLGNNTKAIALLNEAIEKFPKTVFTDLSKLELGICYLKIGKTALALDYIQQVIDNPYDEAIREKARDYLSFVLRHGFRAKTSGFNIYDKDNLFSINIKLKEPKQIIYRRDLKTFYVLDDDTKSVVSIDKTGKVKERKVAEKPQSFFLDNKGNIYIVSKKAILNPDNKLLGFTFTYELKTKFLFNLRECAVDSAGNYYILDNAYKGLFKFDNGGNEIEFPLHRVNDRYKKVVIDKRDRLFLNLDDKALVIYKKDAELVGRIERFEGVSFKEISDIDFDDFGNLYLLDKDAKMIFIYDSMFKEIGKYYFPEGVEVEDFAVGEGGEIYIINKKTKLIELYK